MSESGCTFCTEPKRREMCVACSRSYDRWTRKDDGTVWDAMRWAAERARRFERKRIANHKQRNKGSR